MINIHQVSHINPDTNINKTIEAKFYFRNYFIILTKRRFKAITGSVSRMIISHIAPPHIQVQINLLNGCSSDV